jgi:hypothetical protein
MRRFSELAKDWRRRTFGIRTVAYFWILAILVYLLARAWTPLRWQLIVGFLLGAATMGVALLPEVLLPDYIQRWQRGAWGEQNTAKVLKRLEKQGWRVRHDLATRYGKGNRDHIVAGPAVYLLNSKLLKDRVWLEGDVLHVERMDESGDAYEVSDLTSKMSKAARYLEHDLGTAVGFPVAVYPVVVIWGYFEAGSAWAGNVAYVGGEQIADWLSSRPVDIRDARKREAIFKWLASLPRA